MYTDKITRATLYGNNNVLMLKGFLFAIKRGPIKTIAIYAKKNIVTGIGVAISNQFSTLLSEGKTQEFHSSFLLFVFFASTITDFHDGETFIMKHIRKRANFNEKYLYS